MKPSTTVQVAVARRSAMHLDRTTLAIFIIAALAFTLIVSQLAASSAMRSAQTTVGLRAAQPTSFAPAPTAEVQARLALPTTLAPQPTVEDEARGGDVPPTSVRPAPTVTNE